MQITEAQIQTVLGPVTPEAIGPTDSHEHLFIRGGLPVLLFPDFRLSDYELIASEAACFKNAGGSAIVEMSPIDWGRDVESLVRLSQETGLHIIAATGFHKTTYYSDIHWIHSYDEEEILKLVCEELEVGMDIHNYSGPTVARSYARAGVIKVGTQRGQFSDTEKKLLRVAARAHQKTGAPIITHTDEGALALEQVAFLVDHGVKPQCIALSHIDRCLDLSYHKEIASTGAYLEYDALTRIDQGFDKSTLQLVLEMFTAGFGNNILLGGDISRQKYWKSYGGRPGLDFLVGGFRTDLSQAGLPDDALDMIYVRNPRALLAWSKSAPELSESSSVTENIHTAGATNTSPDSSKSTFQPKSLRTIRAFVEHGLVTREDESLLEKVAANFSVAISRDLVTLAKKDGSNGPIGRQFIPSSAELSVSDHELLDPIGDEVHALTKTIIHRYPDRLLLKPTHTCPIYCRFCFRREAVGNGAFQISDAELTDALSYVEGQPAVREVILSGGDPLILSDRRLYKLITALHAIDHVEVIRIHTRFPIAEPTRITDKLAGILRGRAAVYVVLHCNHPQELTPRARAACDCFVDNGIPMLSQTVLLRGINDDPETMAQLMRLLVATRIKPYYLHHLDLARGTSHFRIPVEAGQAIMQQLRGRVSGICQPTYVLDIPGGYGKVPIGPTYLWPRSTPSEYMVEDYLGKKHLYVDFGISAETTD